MHLKQVKQLLCLCLVKPSQCPDLAQEWRQLRQQVHPKTLIPTPLPRVHTLPRKEDSSARRSTAATRSQSRSTTARRALSPAASGTASSGLAASAPTPQSPRSSSCANKRCSFYCSSNACKSPLLKAVNKAK